MVFNFRDQALDRQILFQHLPLLSISSLPIVEYLTVPSDSPGSIFCASSALIFQPIDTPHLGVHSSSDFSSSYTSLFFCHLQKLPSISITKMNIMENAVSPTDNHHPSTEERKQSPPAFLDLADSVTYFYIFVVKSSPAHMIPFRQRGWGVICPTCLR